MGGGSRIRITWNSLKHDTDKYMNKSPARIQRLRLAYCPTCGSSSIKRVRRNWKGQYQGKVYVAPSLEYYECPACAECVYDREAMRKIESHSPAFRKKRSRQRAS